MSESELDLKEATRRPEVVQKLFDQLIVESGSKQYRIEVLKAELLELNQKLFNLSKEYQNALQIHTPKISGINQEASQ